MKKLLVAGLALLAVGCFNYTYIMQIAEDGSGSLRLEMEAPHKKNVWISIDEFTEGYESEGWKTTALSVDTLDTTMVYHLEGKFDHPLAAPDVFDPDVFDIDTLSFSQGEKEEAHRFHLYKEYASAVDKEDIKWIEELVIKLTHYDLDDYTWQEKLILPGSIVEHNADAQQGDTLIWKRRPMDVFKKGLIMEATWEVEP